MLTRRTAFILGAGASRPYGFPSGAELVNIIYAGTRKPNMHPAANLTKCGFEFEHVKEFGTDLKLSGLPSIDAFLEHRKEFREVGKAAIVAVLLPLEKESCFVECQVKHENSPWYDYFIRSAGDMREIVKRERLIILTFNYDRSIDHFLFLHFRKAYGLDESQAADICALIPIVHLYGKLGELEHVDRKEGLAYGARADDEAIRKSATTIKVLYEGVNASSEFEYGIDLLRSAEVICFLGFGYHRQNIARLQVLEVAKNKALMGSGYGITPEERYPILKTFDNKLEMGLEAHDTLAYLRNSPVLHRM